MTAPHDFWQRERIRQGFPEGMEDLYNLVQRTAERYFCWQFGTQECMNRVPGLYRAVLDAVLDGGIDDSARLECLVRAAVRRQALTEIRRTRTKV